jgi:hypothetical protein
VRWLNRLFEFVGKVGLFSLRVVADFLRPPFEFCPAFPSARRSWKQITRAHRRIRLRPGSRDDSPHKKHPRGTVPIHHKECCIPTDMSGHHFFS